MCHNWCWCGLPHDLGPGFFCGFSMRFLSLLSGEMHMEHAAFREFQRPGWHPNHLISFPSFVSIFIIFLFFLLLSHLILFIIITIISFFFFFFFSVSIFLALSFVWECSRRTGAINNATVSIFGTFHKLSAGFKSDKFPDPFPMRLQRSRDADERNLRQIGSIIILNRQSVFNMSPVQSGWRRLRVKEKKKKKKKKKKKEGRGGGGGGGGERGGVCVWWFCIWSLLVLANTCVSQDPGVCPRWWVMTLLLCHPSRGGGHVTAFYFPKGRRKKKPVYLMHSATV